MFGQKESQGTVRVHRVVTAHLPSILTNKRIKAMAVVEEERQINQEVMLAIFFILVYLFIYLFINKLRDRERINVIMFFICFVCCSLNDKQAYKQKKL